VGDSWDVGKHRTRHSASGASSRINPGVGFLWVRCYTDQVGLILAWHARLNSVILASSDDERGTAQNNLGIALRNLGERESGTARLEEVVAAYCNKGGQFGA
jgi:hypothetical protein